MTPEIDQLARQLRARIATIREAIQDLTGEKYILEREATALMTGKNPRVVMAELEIREIVLPNAREPDGRHASRPGGHGARREP